MISGPVNQLRGDLKRSWFTPGACALTLVVAFMMQGLAAPAMAQTYTVTVNHDIDIGIVTSAVAGDTVFRVDPSSSAVSLISGAGTRVTAGGSRAMVTISCAAVAPMDCTKAVKVQIGTAGSPTRRERTLTRLTYTLGTATLGGPPGAPGSGALTIAAIGPNSSKTFYVGADMTVAGDDSGLATGDAEADFFAYAAETPSTPTTGAIGRAKVRVLRSITVAKTSDLNFGAVIRPSAAGTGTVLVNAATGLRTFTGTAQGANSPTPTRAVFTVSGEGGQVFTLTIPATFQMTGPGAPLTVTTTSTASGSQVLSTALGASGTFVFGLGGAFPVTGATTNGTYSGTFTVSVTYN